MSDNITRCSHCGAALDLTKATNGFVRCDYCQSVNPVLDCGEEGSNLLNVIYKRRNELKFDECEDTIDSWLPKLKADPKDNASLLAELYFQKFLCGYGIIYVDEDGNSTEKPTLNRLSERSCFDDSNFQEAMKYANAHQKDSYEQAVQEIDDIRKLACEKLSTEEPYDVFLSLKVKTLDGKGYTVDNQRAKEIYDQLTAAGYRVFYSEVTLKQKVGAEYEPIIYHALSTASVFLLLCTDDVDNILQPWVQNEWSRYLKRVQESKDDLSLIPVITDKVDISALPAKLKKFQALKYDPQFWPSLEKILRTTIKRNVGFTAKKKEVKIDIKPIQVVEKKIEKTVFGGKKEKIVIPANDETRLKRILGEMSSMVSAKNQRKKKKAARYREQSLNDLQTLLKANDRYFLAYWTLYLLLNGIANEGKLSETSFNLTANDLSALDKCFALAPQEFVEEKLSLLRKQFDNSIYDDSFASALPLYEFLLKYVNEKGEIELAYNYENALAQHISESRDKKPKNLESSIDKVSETVYGVLTKGGTERVVSYYDHLATAYRNVGNFAASGQYVKKALELFEADPTALWNQLLNKYKISGNENLAKLLKNPREVYLTIEKMLKGGYRIENLHQNRQNYVTRIINLCINYLKLNAKSSYLLFKEVVQVIPNAKEYMDDEEFNEYFYQIVSDYATRNLWVGRYKEAREFAELLIANNLQTPETYWILLKAGLKKPTNFDLLMIDENRDFQMDKSKTDYDNIIAASQAYDEANSGKGKGKSKAVSWLAVNDDFHALWDRIAIERRSIRSQFVKTLKEAKKYFLTVFDGGESESVQYLSSLVNKSTDDLLTALSSIRSEYYGKANSFGDSPSESKRSSRKKSVDSKYKKKQFLSLRNSKFSPNIAFFTLFALAAPSIFLLLSYFNVNVGMANAYISLFVVIPLGLLWTIAYKKAYRIKLSLVRKIFPLLATAVFAALPFLLFQESLMERTKFVLVEYLPMIASILLGLVYLFGNHWVPAFRSRLNSILAIIGIAGSIALTYVFRLDPDSYYSLLYNFHFPGL